MIDPTPPLALYAEMNRQKIAATIQRTPHPLCPACGASRLHNEEEWERYHPESRTGIIDGKFIGRAA